METTESVISNLKKVWNAFNNMEHELYADYVFDALGLLKEHKEHEELLTKLGYHWTGNGETLALCKKSKVGEQE